MFSWIKYGINFDSVVFLLFFEPKYLPPLQTQIGHSSRTVSSRTEGGCIWGGSITEHLTTWTGVTTQVVIAPSVLTSYGMLGKLFDLSVPQCPILQNEKNYTYLI